MVGKQADRAVGGSTFTSNDFINRNTSNYILGIQSKFYYVELQLHLTYNILQGNIWQQVLSFHFILELLTTLPFAMTVCIFFSNWISFEDTILRSKLKKISVLILGKFFFYLFPFGRF